MLDSSLLNTNFVGRDGFVWWIGRVADPKVWRNESTDPEEGWAYRCKTRIIGYHTFDDQVLPDDLLPWCHVLVDASKGAGQGSIASSSQMLGGETVFGFFLDGEEAQQPVIFGALPRSMKSSEPHGPDNTSKSELPIFTGRTITGKTTYPPASGGNSTGVNDNAGKKVGISSTLDPKRFEGTTTVTLSDNFDPTGLGPHTFNNACENDAFSEITHAIGSFLTTINGLTEYAGEYIDTLRNTVVDINQMLGKVTRIVNGAVKKIIRLLRDKVLKFLGKRFRDFIALLVPEPQQSPIIQAFKRIMDFVFCVFDKLGIDILGSLKDLFKEMIGKALNPTVCAIEQAVGAIMGSINDGLSNLLRPIMGGLDWLTGAIGGIGNLLSSVSSYIDMLLSFLACDSLQCKDYDDWIQGEKGFKKPPLSWLSILDASEKMKAPVEVTASNKAVFDTFSDGQINSILETKTGEVSAAGQGGTVTKELKEQLTGYVQQQDEDRKKNWRLNNIFTTLNDLADEDYPPNFNNKFSLLSILGNEAAAFFDCNEKTNNPKNQDDLGRGVPPGFVWGECLPPKVEVSGDGTKTAALLPIVSSVDGSILTLEILDGGFGYTTRPTITIIDKTRHGGGARAEAILDGNGSIVSIFMYSVGAGYCPSTNVVPPIFLAQRGLVLVSLVGLVMMELI